MTLISFSHPVNSAGGTEIGGTRWTKRLTICSPCYFHFHSIALLLHSNQTNNNRPDAQRNEAIKGKRWVQRWINACRKEDKSCVWGNFDGWRSKFHRNMVREITQRYPNRVAGTQADGSLFLSTTRGANLVFPDIKLWAMYRSYTRSSHPSLSLFTSLHLITRHPHVASFTQ